MNQLSLWDARQTKAKVPIAHAAAISDLPQRGSSRIDRRRPLLQRSPGAGTPLMGSRRARWVARSRSSTGTEREAATLRPGEGIHHLRGNGGLGDVVNPDHVSTAKDRRREDGQ